MIAADVFRTGVYLASAATVGLTMMVVFTYAKVYRAHRKANAPKWRGLLPLHVTLIGLAYLTLVLGSVIEVAGRDNEALTWRGPVYLVANSIGAAALWIIFGTSRYRQHSIEPPA